MHQNLIDAGLTFPAYWDEDKVIKALTTLTTFELYAYFGCSNASSFTRLMKPCFPNRPEKTSYSKYVTDLVKSIPKPKWDIKASQKAYEQNSQFD
jgi:hypothetical protein